MMNEEIAKWWWMREDHEQWVSWDWSNHQCNLVMFVICCQQAENENQSNNEWNWRDEDEMTSSKYEPKAQSSVGVWCHQMIMVEIWVGRRWAAK